MNSQKVQGRGLWQEPLLRPYLGEVRRKFGVVEILALPSLRDLPAIQIETLFVPPFLCSDPVHADDDPEQWPTGQNLISDIQEFKRIVVLGDPGGGKTTLSNWLAWRLASGASAPLPSNLKNKIPLPCVLREMPSLCFERGFSIADLALVIVEKLVGQYKAQQLSSLIRMWVERGDYVLILDGIDEVSVSRRKVIASWMSEAYRQDALVLATSRVVGYEDHPIDGDSASSEQASNDISIGIEKPRPFEVLKRTRQMTGLIQPGTGVKGKEWAKLRYLMPFNKLQISDFARNWYSQRCVNELEAKQRASDLLVSLAQSEITEKLARTPNLLTLMAIVHRERAHLPDGKALLYDEIVNAYLNTIDSQRKIGEELSLAKFSWKEKKSWLAYVGFRIQESRDWSSSATGILVAEEKVIEWLEEAIKEDEVEDYEAVAKEFLDWVARRSGLLLPRGENKYAFVHLSFQEYFCAHFLESSIVRPAFVRNTLPPDSAVTRKKLAAWGQHPVWLETYIFLFESVSAEHGFDWVEVLIDIVFADRKGILATLAARLLKNKHVKLQDNVRDFLAEGCVSSIFREANYKPAPDSEVFRILLDNGYVSHVSGESYDYDRLQNDELAANKVRALIADDHADLSSSFLSGLTNLMALSVIDSSVDLLGLNRSHDLCWLRLRDSEVLNFDEIGYLAGINFLELCRIDVEDLFPLASLKRIEALEIEDLPVCDLSPLSALKSISTLELSWLDVTDLSPLCDLKKIVTLSLVGLASRSVEFIGGLKALRDLQIFKMNLDSFDFFANCRRLEFVDFFSMDYLDLTPFSRLPKLDGIFLDEIKDCDITPVGKMRSLQMFSAENMVINKTSVFSKCKNLYGISLVSISFLDFDGFNSLKGLNVRELILRKISDLQNLDFITGLKGLRYLDLRETKVSDISALSSFDTSFRLVISEGHGHDLDSLKKKEGFIIDEVAVDNKVE